MSIRNIWKPFTTIILIVLTACSVPPTQPAPAPVSSGTPVPNMPNPASAYCEQQGNKLEIRTAADGSQTGICIFPDGSECDEWAFFRGECSPASQNDSTIVPTVEAASPVPSEIPTALPINTADYQGWWTYNHAVYGFSIMLPEDWIVDETTTFDPLMNGHTLILHPHYDMERESIRMTFRRTGEDVPLWPTGVGQGEFLSQGTLDIAGGPAQRVLLVCPTGEVTAIWYHQAEGQPNILRNGLEFGFIFSAASHCETGFSLSGKVQRVGEMIIASLKVL
jgi:putative hemolysin